MGGCSEGFPPHLGMGVRKKNRTPPENGTKLLSIISFLILFSRQFAFTESVLRPIGRGFSFCTTLALRQFSSEYVPRC